MATNTWFELCGSTSKPDTYRFGTVPSTGRVSWCQPVPSVLPAAMPRVKPWSLQGPHQPTYAVPPETDTAVATCPAPRSNALIQSAPLWMAKPLCWIHTCRPPATQVLMSLASAANGAMNRAPAGPAALSGGAMLRLDTLDGSVVHEPSLTAQLLVTDMARYTYSEAMLQPLFGSTRTSPPSPPKLEPMTLSPGRRIDTPLSCRPPEMAGPTRWLYLSRPVETE